jgi:CHAD domain-containing protein
MAKAKEITGLDCAANAADWAREVLRVRFHEVLELRDIALDFSDIEGVHSMRVATRRLRSALRDFMLLMDKRALKGVRRELKIIADALGAVRDQDVAVMALQKLAAQPNLSEDIKQGIERFTDERQTIRAAAQMNLSEALNPSQLADLQANFNNFVEEAITKNQKKKNKKNFASVISFNQAGRAAVAASFANFYELGTSLYDPFDVEALHEMRIAAKQLRYALELFTACWGNRILPFIDEISEMQAVLGEVHDADLWIESLGQRLRDAQETENQAAAFWLLSEFARRRSKNYRSALLRWGEWQTSNFAERIKSTIGSQ